MTDILDVLFMIKDACTALEDIKEESENLSQSELKVLIESYPDDMQRYNDLCESMEKWHVKLRESIEKMDK